MAVVWFERRSGLCLGAVRNEGGRKLGLVDERGEAVRIPGERVLARLSAELPDRADPGALAAELRALRGSWAARPVPDTASLRAHLDAQRPLGLAQLAERALGSAGDAELAALVGALHDEEQRLLPSFRIRAGGLVRPDSGTLQRIEERAERAAAAERAQAALLAWWHQDAPGPPPAAAEQALDGLRALALSGAPGEAREAAALAKRLGLAEPDELLGALEERGALPRHTNELPARRKLAREFSPAQLAAAAELAAQALDERGEDLRALPTVAVDTPGTDEVDDAFSLGPGPDGREWLWVHVARPGDALEPGDELDAEAARRATSIYFPEETISMLPEAVVARHGLVAGVDREALSWGAPVEEDDTLGPGRFARTVVRVAAQASYDDALEHPLAGELLRRVEPICERLRARRTALGALTLRTPNVRVELGPDGEPAPRLLPDGRAQRAVAELMVLYNARIADALADAGAAAPYRVQAEPIAAVPDTDDPVEILAARRALPPTRVQPRPGPQLTMGLERYVQASSPLRRYLDLVAQRQLLAALDQRPWPETRGSLGELLNEVSGRERRARAAEEDRLRYFLCRWLELRADEDATLLGLVSRAGERPSLFLPEWQREVHTRAPRGLTLRLGAEVEAVVERARARTRSALLRVLD
ncbi:MAG: ribonuclease catalytic domain-containing protein [Planctomycetota bacterium]